MIHILTYFPLFLVFLLYRKYKERRRRLDDILLSYKRDCVCYDGEYSIVISMGDEKKTIQGCLEGVLSQTLKPKAIHLFVEARDNTVDKILETLNKYRYRVVEVGEIQRILSENEYQWNKHLRVEIVELHSDGMPPVYLYISKGDVIGKGLSINWLVKEGYVDTPYFLQLDADAIPEPNLAKKLLCTIKRDRRIAGVYAFAYEVAEDKGFKARVLADYGYNMYKRMSHVIFRESWNYLEFCVTMEGLHIMFRTEVYRKIPRPVDTLAGDMAHSWELQSKGYIVLENIYAKSIVREISTFRGLIKQRLKWNAGPIQNLYRRGASTLKGINDKWRRVKAAFAIGYSSIISPLYQSFWLIGPLLLALLGVWKLHQIIGFYTIDFTMHLGSAIYSTRYLRKKKKNT